MTANYAETQLRQNLMAENEIRLILGQQTVSWGDRPPIVYPTDDLISSVKAALVARSENDICEPSCEKDACGPQVVKNQKCESVVAGGITMKPTTDTLYNTTNGCYFAHKRDSGSCWSSVYSYWEAEG